MTGEADGDERTAVVAMLRRMVCEAVAGDTKPKFVCATPAKASAVLAFAFSKIAESIENGEHLKAALPAKGQTS